MKRLLLLALAAQCLAACDKKPDFLKTEAEKAAERATPIPRPTPTGNWMFKDYKNPLDPKKK